MTAKTTKGQIYAADHAKDIGQKLHAGAVIINELLDAFQHPICSPREAIELGADAGRWVAEAFAIAADLEA